MRIIAGTAGSRTIEAPPGRDTRPTLDRVRENLFNMLQGRVYGAKVLDLFAGSGALSFEALSRGAESAVLCDRDREAIRAEKKNAETLGFADRTRILHCDWTQTLRRMKEEEKRFDLVFLDPPYVMTDLREVMDALRGLLEEDAVVVVEHEAKVTPVIPDTFEAYNARNWGYCGVSFCRLKEGST